jgi:uncharacterized integral membrane protein
MGPEIDSTSSQPDVTVDPPPQQETRPEPPRSTRARRRGGLPVSRVGRAWTALLPAGLVLVVVLVFVFQNLQRSDVSFLGWSGSLPLGLALLVAAALGALAVFLLGSVRILQLRHMTRRTG